MHVNNNIFNLFSESYNINKKYFAVTNKNYYLNTHNEINNLYIANIKNKKILKLKYFKIILPIIYKHIYNKTIIYKNIKYDIFTIKELKKILNDYSYIIVYEFLNYYIDNINISKNITALFYSTIYFNNKKLWN